MPTMQFFALGALALIAIVSLFVVLRRCRSEKTDYERWLEEAQKHNIVKPRRSYPLS